MILLNLLLAAAVLSRAGPAPAIPELAPRPVKFPATELMLQDALAQLQKQTGNVLHDRRTIAGNPKLRMPAKAATFWATIDAIGKQTGIGFSAYQPDGGVALVDTPYRPLKTHYSGLFRFAVKRIAVSRDFDAQAHVCHVTLDIAWEPRFQPLYLALDRAQIEFAKGAKGVFPSEKLDRQTARNVALSGATELDLLLKAPDRSTPAIETLKGAIHVIGPTKMLDFTFAKLKDQTAEQEGVRVSFRKEETSRQRWSVDVLIENPPGAIPLDSYQQHSWMENNRVWLEWTDPKTKTVRKLDPSGSAPQESAKGTKMRYHFTPAKNMPLPATSADAALHCLTPNRVVAITVPFEFRGLELP